MLTRGQFKYLVCLSMAYIAILLSSEILLHKLVAIGSIVVSAGSLMAPLWFVLTDVIAEVYGYRASKIIFFCFLFVFFFCILLVVILIYLPSPPGWRGESDYLYVAGELLRQFFSGLIAFLVGGMLNIRLITKWKALLNGRFFWLRSIAASIISEVVFTIIAFSIILYGTPDEKHIFSIIACGIAMKFIANVVLSCPAGLLVMHMKHNGYGEILPDGKFSNPFRKINSDDNQL